MHAGLLASDGCFSSALTALIGVLSTAQARRPGGRPLDPADPRRCHRYRAHSHYRGAPDRPGDDAPARTAGPRGRRGARARDNDCRGHAQRARSARHPGRSSGPSACHRRGLPPALTLSGAPDEWLRHAAHRHDRRRHADPQNRRLSGSMPSRRIGSAEWRVRSAATGEQAVGASNAPGVPGVSSYRGMYVHASSRQVPA
jgi:hypothetical protein